MYRAVRCIVPCGGSYYYSLLTRGKAWRDSPVLELLAAPGEYGGMIRQFPVRNMISTPNFMDIWCPIYDVVNDCCKTIPEMTYTMCITVNRSLLLFHLSPTNLAWIYSHSHWLTTILFCFFPHIFPLWNSKLPTEDIVKNSAENLRFFAPPKKNGEGLPKIKTCVGENYLRDI